MDNNYDYWNKMRQRAEINMIAEHYGLEHQMKKAIEELAELTIELSKENFSLHQTKYEIVDVAVMIYQLIYLLEIDEYSFDYCIEYKVKRQLERIRLEKEAQQAQEEAQGEEDF